MVQVLFSFVDSVIHFLPNLNLKCVVYSLSDWNSVVAGL